MGKAQMSHYSITNFLMMWNIFSFKTSDGLELYGGLIKGKKRTKSAVIHVHGMGDFFYKGKLPETIAQAANEAGHDFFAFNNRGMGVVSMIKGKFLGTSLERFEECRKDISAAITTLQKLGYRHFILSGHSTGCQKTAYYLATAPADKKRHILSLILLSPADDLNFHKQLLGKSFSKLLKQTELLTKKFMGDTILPKEFKTSMFSAQRFYHLLKENSIEGNIFNYEKPLKTLSRIAKPVLAVFGEEEQYAAMSPAEMLKKIAETFTNKHSKTALIADADHSFHGEEKSLYRALKKFLTAI